MKTSFTLLCLLASFTLSAQARLTNQVLSSAGFESVETFMTSSTIGETAIGFSIDASTMLHSGFQQQFSEASTPTVAFKSLQISFFPNPVHEVLTIEFSEKSPKQMQYQLFDALGLVQMEGQLDHRRNISLENLSPGSYVLRIVTQEGTGSVKIQKI